MNKLLRLFKKKSHNKSIQQPQIQSNSSSNLSVKINQLATCQTNNTYNWVKSTANYFHYKTRKEN